MVIQRAPPFWKEPSAHRSGAAIRPPSPSRAPSRSSPISDRAAAFDVLPSALVGPTAKANGLNMTDEMLELARKNQSEAGVTNVEAHKGEIESIPLLRLGRRDHLKLRDQSLQ
jgi:hypothetical protein